MTKLDTTTNTTNKATYINNALLVFSLFISALFIGITAYGAWTGYLSVPYLDTYNVLASTLKKPLLSNLFTLHNEHRIVLTKILLWIDYSILNGLHIFLITINFALMACIAWSYLWFFNKTIEIKKETRPYCLLLSVFSAFSFVQKENITWEFQSQFFLVILLPMLSCLCLCIYIDAKDTAKKPWLRLQLFLSWFFLILNVLNMGNGIIFFALYSILLYIYKITNRFFTITLFACTAIYQIIFSATLAQKHSFFDVVTQKTTKFLLYIPAYLGSVSYTVGGYIVSIFFGSILLGCFVFFSYRAFKSMPDYLKNKPVVFIHITLVAYIILTASATALGRIELSNPFVSRYTTPSIMAFLFCILGLLSVTKTKKSLKRVLIIATLTSIGLFIPPQIQTSNEMIPTGKMLSGLSYAYNINDTEAQKIVHFDNRIPKEVLQLMKKKNIGYVTIHPYFFSTKSQDKWLIPEGFKAIYGKIDSVETIVSEDTFTHVRGWAFDSKTKAIPPYIYITDSRDHVVGFALLGSWRQELGNVFGREVELAGFEGYLLRSAETSLDDLRYYSSADAF
jgi:hypothetical protein